MRSELCVFSPYVQFVLSCWMLFIYFGFMRSLLVLSVECNILRVSSFAVISERNLVKEYIKKKNI